MEIPRWLKRGLASIIGSAGLAYPVCATICPRGRGYCPYPGRCFLYTDVDANAICDYTPRSVTTAPTAASPAPVASPVPEVTSSLSALVTSSVTPAATVSSNASVPFTPDTGFFLPDGLFMGAVVTVILLVLFFFLFRSGVLGPRLQKTVSALGASALFALGIGEMVTYLLLGEETLASAFAVIYLLAGTLLAAVVWKSRAMSRKVAVGTVMMSALFGFIILAPLMPMEFPGIVSIATSGQTLAPGIIGILAGIGLVLLVGRTFCGHLCPVGSVQELAWNVPGKKIDIRKTRYLEVFRAGVFVATVIGAVFYVNLMEYTGIYDFFSLTLSIGLVVFLVLLLLSILVYRPVCRGICPFGLLFSIPAHFSLFRLRRTSACISCKKCEKACPAHVAGQDSSKRECYLCARCTAACPVPGALVYKR